MEEIKRQSKTVRYNYYKGDNEVIVLNIGDLTEKDLPALIDLIAKILSDEGFYPKTFNVWMPDYTNRVIVRD